MKQTSMYCLLKSDALPSCFIILLGSIDCLTTLIGTLYTGAVEVNPIMKGIIGTNVMMFLVLKISATLTIGLTYILAKRMLNNSSDTPKYSGNLMNAAYAGIIILLIITVANNLTVISA
jgi:hypothetical protein